MTTLLLAGFLASSVVFSTPLRAAQGKAHAGMAPAAAVAASTLPHPAAAPLIASSVTSAREAAVLRKLWGVDDIYIRSTAAGSLIRFSYRVADADKAKILNDKKATPYLIDEKNGLALQVPVMEKVGQLRQVATPQNGREYWMAFSNKGRYVKPGSHVTVVIGRFRAEGLVVEGNSSPPPMNQAVAGKLVPAK